MTPLCPDAESGGTQLERENARLKEMNRILAERLERLGADSARQLQEARESLEQHVSERTRELVLLNRQLAQQIEDRQQAEAALQAAKAEAERANLNKNRLLAAASHDLLQPLNAARFFATALEEARLPERHRSLVANLTLALNAVDELLCALLDISKFDAGAYTPDITDFPIDQIIRLLVEETAPQAEMRRLSLRWVHSGAVVRSDPILVTRVLRNLLSNAIRYTPAGRILIGCRRRPGGIEVQVCDTGIGIPEDKLTAIFEEFQRLTPIQRDQDRGMGLGLAIVERIARCLGHPLGVRSQAGRGSVFGLLLPHGSAEAVRPRADEQAVPFKGVAETIVMVIENDPGELAGMTALLESWRCTVLAARHPDAALLRAGRLPQAIVADYRLDDGQTGVQALNAMRALCKRPIPGIIVTAERSDEIRAAVREAGFHLLDKPVKPARLRSLLAHVAPHP